MYRKEDECRPKKKKSSGGNEAVNSSKTSLNHWLHGHTWTIGPHLYRTLKPPRLSTGRTVQFEACDPTRSAVPAVGFMHRSPFPRDHLVIVIHGLASNPDAVYVKAMGQVLLDRGCDVFRLALRGSTGLGDDHYHGGQTDELHALVNLKLLADYRRISIVGFSLGGHIALRFATEYEGDRIQRVVAVCPPLCLRSCQEKLDSPRFSPYRMHLIRGLKSTYEALRARGLELGREMSASPDEISRVMCIKEWDATTVVRRFGFADVDDYYSQVSVGPHLAELNMDALIIMARHDPMIPYEAMMPYLEDPGPRAVVRVTDRGGHVGFPADLVLGMSGGSGLENQICSWLER